MNNFDKLYETMMETMQSNKKRKIPGAYEWLKKKGLPITSLDVDGYEWEHNGVTYYISAVFEYEKAPEEWRMIQTDVDDYRIGPPFEFPVAFEALTVETYPDPNEDPVEAGPEAYQIVLDHFFDNIENMTELHRDYDYYS